MRGRRAARGAAATSLWAVPARKYSRRGGSRVPGRLTCRTSTPSGLSGGLPGLRAWSASITSRQTGAAPEVPETARIESPSRLPTHTATVKRSDQPTHQLSRIPFDVPVLAAAQDDAGEIGRAHV